MVASATSPRRLARGQRYRERQRMSPSANAKPVAGGGPFLDHEVVRSEAGNRFAALIRHRRVDLDDADAGGKLRPDGQPRYRAEPQTHKEYGNELPGPEW